MDTPQTPLRSPFGAASTAREVIAGLDLSGQLAIVTGGHSGIGLETTRALSEAGATVIVLARDAAKATKAVGGWPNVEIDTIDLIGPASIDAFAQRFLERGRKLDLLINNAGFINYAFERDARGYESQFATNHLGHFQLTARLWPALTRGARVVTVSSMGHKVAAVDFDDIHFERRPYNDYVAYGQSKSANALFAYSLDRIGRVAGIRSFSLHPGGMITSGFSRDMSEADKKAAGFLDTEGRPVVDPENNMKTLEQGAATTVWCATSPLLKGMGGVYCENCNIAQAVPANSNAHLGVRPWAVSPEAAARLWKVSEEATGVRFPG
ncbi:MULTISPECIES: SDR family NAD(P)-dependent oxidoreductase [unclassified Rhodanobacter]|uniref:SDR family NAD(P)-dependent oxidoreductase n=1 Tax=unclassified Rhodanobacter TaxID=2621553 RepID=UPI001BDF4D07|nr:MULTISPECIES: SDR family NAD(P)-dependent oxidoreductase [unclassified Rhodanobacter]MBT2143873.1 SDR family NAD(P)-dependent oxidoreductase [Rhodanobacter sp. LX-99]MBT2147053.1 SDR family NAD(P)-dependent oxidoreductase [Rhodanobacter sp. LX-100]